MKNYARWILDGFDKLTTGRINRIYIYTRYGVEKTE
jgi:hypothetical protein